MKTLFLITVFCFLSGTTVKADKVPTYQFGQDQQAQQAEQDAQQAEQDAQQAKAQAGAAAQQSSDANNGGPFGMGNPYGR